MRKRVLCKFCSQPIDYDPDAECWYHAESEHTFCVRVPGYAMTQARPE